MAYLLCTKCGQKALSVATRCPHCGLPFENRFYGNQASGSRSSRIPRALVISGAVAVFLLANVVLQKLGVAPPVSPPGTAIVPAAPPEALSQPSKKFLGAVADSVPTAPATQPRLPKESPPPAADSAGLAAPTPTAKPVGTVAAQRRYASTWMNVRADRSNTAPVIRILHPGEAILVDSLKQGWYRVVADQQGLGYADRRFLDTSPPQASP